jgi:poly-beta-1,6-N-acetyl-D-glucosamine N-deacetylase
MLKQIFIVFLRLTLIPFIIREFVQSKKISIIAYHDLKPAIAKKHFKALKKKYNIISLKAYIEAVANNKTDLLPRKSLIITIDDGHKDNIMLMPLLERHKIPVTIFLCSGIVGTHRHFWFMHNDIDNSTRQSLKEIDNVQRLQYLERTGFNNSVNFNNRQALSDQDIQKMKDVIDLQSHTIFHPILTRCSEEEAYEEIVKSRNDLQIKYNLSIYALAYPNGDYSERDILIAKKAGYQCGLTLDHGYNSLDTDLFKLRRICIPDDATLSELLVKTSGVWSFFRRLARPLSPKTGLVIKQM